MDQISGEIDDMQRRSFNGQFGGGCPICRGDNTLDRKRIQREMHAVCSQCGAVFKGVIPDGIKMVEGGGGYAGEIFPINVWRMIRFLPEGDSILATCSDNFVNFYATTSGILREFKDLNFLSYEDIFDIPLVRVWGLNILCLLGFLFFLVLGFSTALLMGPSVLAEGGFVLPVIILGIGFGLLLMGRRQVYQIESPVLSKTESRDWRLRNIKKGDVRNFRAVVRKQLDML